MKNLSKLIPTLIVAMTVSLTAKAELKDTINTNIREYKDELGFFQRANRDPGDPRFMFYDSEGKVDFGIGGTANISAGLGFDGAVGTMKFRPSLITVPSDYTTSFGTKISSSEVHFKARSRIKGHKITAYIKLSGNDNNIVELSQAYISFDGLSIGKIPSFFMDLEVGPMTTGIGITNQVDNTHPLFGYTLRLGEKWTIAAAAEMPSLNLDHYGEKPGSVGTNYQPAPDIALHGKFRWKNGHLQAGAVLRNLAYWSISPNPKFNTDGVNQYLVGYGFSFSGNYRPIERLKLSWEAVYGKGIAEYLPDFSKVNMSVGLNDRKEDGLAKMSTIPVFGAFAAVQYNWSQSFSSSLLAGYSRCYQQDGVQYYDNFKSSFHTTVNFFWNISDFAYAGIEYLFGHKATYANVPGIDNTGHASRFVLQFVYLF